MIIDTTDPRLTPQERALLAPIARRLDALTRDRNASCASPAAAYPVHRWAQPGVCHGE